jgi:predicted nucleic acid-binding protein
VIVVDANALVYALIPGPLTESARQWLARQHQLLAAPLVMDELRNVFLGYVRRGQLTADEAVGLCATVRSQVRFVEPPGDAAVLSLALERGLSAYDATHVAVARSLGLPLLTADKRVLQACPDDTLDVRTPPT